MHRFSTTAVSAAVIAAVAVLGFDHAGSASSRGVQAAPFAPVRNIAHVYTVDTNGGVGVVTYTVPIPFGSTYQVSFTANFHPAFGTPTAPVTLSCVLIKNGRVNLTQGTVQDAGNSDWYLGISGIATTKISLNGSLSVTCGTLDGSDWLWGDRPLTVTLTRLDGYVTAPITAGARSLHPTPRFHPAAGAIAANPDEAR
jgi:hypothetical protein